MNNELSPWLYNNEPITLIEDGVIGFIYLITQISTGKKYIGKKKGIETEFFLNGVSYGDDIEPIFAISTSFNG